MSEEENNRIVIPDEDGNEHLFDVLFEFESDNFNASYVVVVPTEQNKEDAEEDAEVDLFAFRYQQEGDDESDVSLEQIPEENEEEWEMIESTIETLLDEEEV
ncbi:uncharacterized protein YrzB (UPF0473 family) [Salsuginibacillus halophilus]|uniref:UPF0473 protein B0H94_10787 n=1 Tax=Salsuginibacillus halophilus TaxID=517424 RepID=A0A2P8HFR9_9BACI|nr:DUF1292 domain-containing protein [Salsuginibacillus halophilus]PSL45082.1 uncharacterized protein YrzB (UPF0473 family) [Salsuginibacillus halophilus]